MRLLRRKLCFNIQRKNKNKTKAKKKKKRADKLKREDDKTLGYSYKN
jgi:hypothetical protein